MYDKAAGTPPARPNLPVSIDTHRRPPRGATLYIMDEPTTGLHPRDVDRLMRQLNRLVDAGNTVIVVEHDMRTVLQCDWVVDMGPGAGDSGGKIVAEGRPSQIAAHPESRTAPYLNSALDVQTSADAMRA